jgi:hypothetical protein
MRTWIGSLAIAVITLGLVGAMPSDAQAQLRRVQRPVTTTNYNSGLNFSSYPWNYYFAQMSTFYPDFGGAYGYGYPYAYPYNYGPLYASPYASPYSGYSPYYVPSYSYSYSMPTYNYSYGPGYLNYSVTPGYYFFRYR